MKTRSFWHWSVGVGLVVIPLAMAWVPKQPDLSTQAEASPTHTANADRVALEPMAAEALAESAVDATATNAPAVVKERTLPSSLNLSSAAQDLIKLVDAGVDESVMLAFATSSATRFDLGSEEIIYLTDLGLPGSVITAMLQHDHVSTGTDPNPAPVPASASAPEVHAAPTPVAPISASFSPSPSTTDSLTGPTWVQDTTPVSYETEPFPSANSEPAPAPPVTTVTYNTFYDTLSPYGTWVVVPGYGSCWRPTVVTINSGWKPYVDSGCWVYSDCGWYWRSSYSWGWAPFHYGRWYCAPRVGWCWVPGTVWGPSWVCWRNSGDYCGWAPLPPSAGFTVGIGLTWGGRPAGVDCGFSLAANCFSFVRFSSLCASRLNVCVAPVNQVSVLYAHSTVNSRVTRVNGMDFHHGPAVTHVAAASHRDIRPMPVRDLTSPHNPTGRGNRLTGSLTGTVHQNATQARGVDSSPTSEPQLGSSGGNRSGSSVVVLGGRNRNQDRVPTGSGIRDAARGNPRPTSNPRQAGTTVASLPPQQAAGPTANVPHADRDNLRQNRNSGWNAGDVNNGQNQQPRGNGNGSGYNNNNGSRQPRGWQTTQEPNRPVDVSTPRANQSPPYVPPVSKPAPAPQPQQDPPAQVDSAPTPAPAPTYSAGAQSAPRSGWTAGAKSSSSSSRTDNRRPRQ